MNQIKIVRKLVVFTLIFASLLALSACKSTEKTPYGSINDDIYVQIGDAKVTQRELYDQMRLQGASVLASMIDEAVFKDQIATTRALLNNGDAKTNEFLDKTVNTAIHGTNDPEQLEQLYEKYPERFYRNIEKFADSLYLLDNNLNISALITALETLEGKYEGYRTITPILDNYVLRVTQREFARGILTDLQSNDKDTNYISEANLVTYYNANIKGRYDVDALVIRFINQNEADAALQKIAIKSDSRGAWYRVPDIRISNPLDENYVDLTDPGFAHVKKILDNLNISYADRTQISISEFAKYYLDYRPNPNRTDGNEDIPLTTAQVKVEFVNIYNLLNPTTQVEIESNGHIVAKSGSSFEPTKTYDELNKINSSLRNHIYSTLVSWETMEDKDDVTNGRPYSARTQTFGSSRYLVFRIDDTKDTEEGILVTDPNDPDKEVFGTSEAAVEKRAEVYDEVFEARLTDQFISDQVKKLYEDKQIDIYDRILRIFYDQNYGYEGTDKTRSGDILATAGGVDIKVDDFFARLEKSFGINLSLDLLLSKVLSTSDKYTVTKEERDAFQKQFEDIISQFSADNFASAGYPASMGREKFLLTAFGARTNTEAINQVYIFPELRNQYLEDLEAHYHSESDTIYTKLAEFAAMQYNNFRSINVSHLLVYLDSNGDGTPDDPQKYLDELGATEQQNIKDGLVELVTKIYQIVGEYKSHAEGLQAIANEFNNSGRIEIGSRSKPIDYQIELDWAEYRQLGFYLKFEPIGQPVTNTSNFITGQMFLDPIFYNRAMKVYQDLNEMIEDDSKFPHLDLYDSVITEALLDEVQSSFGWHLILATGVAQKNSAIYSQDDDNDGRYLLDNGLNPYNEDSVTLTASQVEYYLFGEKSDEDVVLPSAVQTAIQSYLTPVLTRYRNQNMQRELVFMLLEDVNFTSQAAKARFDTIRAINLRQMDEYQLSINPKAVNDPNYGALYGTWMSLLNR